MINLKATCDKRRAKKDGTHPIVFRLSYNGQSRDISTGLSCNKSDWDYNNNLIKPKNAHLQLLGDRIREKEINLLNRIREYERKFPEGGLIQNVKNHICSQQSTDGTVKEFWIKEIERMKKANRFGNARNLESALVGLLKITPLNIPFETMNYKWLIDTETTLKANGLKVNSIGVYYRTLRSIYNSAINHDLVEANSYPFRKYKIKRESTQPRVASITELKSFFKYVPSNNKFEDAWNYGRLIFLLRGINFTDLALLTQDNIKHNRIIYKRSKTKKLYSIELLKEAKAILKRCADPNRNTLIPILSNEELMSKSNLPRLILQKRDTCNKWLKRIGQELKISEDLSTYVFRYSYASACQKLGYSKELISRSLGHSFGLSVTNCYLEDYDLSIIDEMNRTVCKKVTR